MKRPAAASCFGMGTTIVAALVHDTTLAIAHVGDSRLYVFADGALRLLTADDSWALNRNVLTNVLDRARRSTCTWPKSR
jgi:protein phosphatase